MPRSGYTSTEIEMEKITYQRQGFVEQIATGFYGVWWAITHPGKGLLRGLGVVGGLATVIMVTQCGAHLIAGEPGTAQATGSDVGSWGRAGADVIRPTVTNAAEVVTNTNGRQMPVRVETRPINATEN